MPHDTITGTIQLDKLVFSCTATDDRSFFEAVQNDVSLFCAANIGFNNTTLSRTTDPSNRYRYSYAVHYAGKTLGQIDFAPYVIQFQQERIKFTVANTVFYNGTHIYLEPALNDLALHIENYTKIDIATDSYTFNFEQAMRRGIRNLENRIKLLHKIIRDPDKLLKEITYYNQGTRKNPFKLRTILIKTKSRNKRKEYTAYNKLEEIKHESGKEYIIDYHKRQNPKLKHIYRAEIRLDYNAIKYIEKKRGKIQLSMLFDSNFLWEVFDYEANTMISIRDSDLNEVALYQKPNKTAREKVDNNLPSHGVVAQDPVAIKLTCCNPLPEPETECIQKKDPEPEIECIQKKDPEPETECIQKKDPEPETECIQKEDTDSVPLPKKKKKKKKISSTKRRILRNRLKRIEKEVKYHQKHGHSKMFGSGKLNMETVNMEKLNTEKMLINPTG